MDPDFERACVWEEIDRTLETIEQKILQNEELFQIYVLYGRKSDAALSPPETIPQQLVELFLSLRRLQDKAKQTPSAFSPDMEKPYKANAEKYVSERK